MNCAAVSRRYSSLGWTVMNGPSETYPRSPQTLAADRQLCTLRTSDFVSSSDPIRGSNGQKGGSHRVSASSTERVPTRYLPP
jgi:hypothetical protein